MKRVGEKPKTGVGGRCKQLRLAVETEEDRRAKLENEIATKRLRLAIRKKSKTGENGINHTAQVSPGGRGIKKSKKRNGFD